MEFEKLKNVISEVLNVDPEEITLDTTFTDDLGADSLDLFQIIMGLEEEFDIEIPAEAAEVLEENNSDVAIEAPFEEILTEEENGIVNEGVENDEQE